MKTTQDPGGELLYLRQFLGPDYTDIRPLGEVGGLSHLFLAFKISLRVDVVIKRMVRNPRQSASADREVEAMISLRHQYLPRIFAFESDNRGFCYIIMEYIAGMTLRRYIETYGVVDQKQMLRWFRQLSETVAYMHSRQIRHCDIKPENIIITPENNICLIDFNTSLATSEQQAVGISLGYAAPEQYNFPPQNLGNPAAMGETQQILYRLACQAQNMGPVTDRTDIFSMGAVAYYMMTGYDPAPWCDPQLPLTQFRIVLGDPLRQIIERCMEPLQDRRFSSAQSVLDALNDLGKTDKRYLAWKRSCQLACLLIGAGLILSIFATVQGALRMRTEGGEAYTRLVTEAQREVETNPDNAEELYYQAVQMDRDRPDAYAGLGALYYAKGEYRQAADMLAELDPDRNGDLDDAEAARMQGQIQYLLASCRYQLQEYKDALTSYETAIYLCPDEPDWQRDLAVCHARLGNVQEAEDALQTLRELTTRPGDLELVTGEIRYAQGSYAEALTQLQQAATVSENHEVILRAALQAAQSCQQLGQTQTEISLLQSAAQRLDASENAPLYQVQAEAWMRLAVEQPDQAQNSYEQALACFTTLMDRNQGTFAIRENAALVLEYLNRFSEAEQILLDLQTDFPSDYRPPMRLALLSWDVQSNTPAESRSFDAFRTYYQQAKSLYNGTTPDNDMVRLDEFAAQLG